MTSSRFIFLLAENFGSLASTFSPYDSICSKMVIIFHAHAYEFTITTTTATF
ncbi:MAG: hypothetical protein ACJ70Z_07650 [Nitrososphaera sp.]